MLQRFSVLASPPSSCLSTRLLQYRVESTASLSPFPALLQPTTQNDGHTVSVTNHTHTRPVCVVDRCWIPLLVCFLFSSFSRSFAFSRSFSFALFLLCLSAEMGCALCPHYSSSLSSSTFLLGRNLNVCVSFLKKKLFLQLTAVTLMSFNWHSRTGSVVLTSLVCILQNVTA